MQQASELATIGSEGLSLCGRRRSGWPGLSGEVGTALVIKGGAPQRCEGQDWVAGFPGWEQGAGRWALSAAGAGSQAAALRTNLLLLLSRGPTFGARDSRLLSTRPRGPRASPVLGSRSRDERGERRGPAHRVGEGCGGRRLRLG